MTEAEASTQTTVRTRILNAAEELIAKHGPEAATTRAVAAAAGVQPPMIYRLFGDKQRLLEAVVEEAFSEYVASKAMQTPHADPIEDLRNGWDMHIAFGLSRPGLFVILSSIQRPNSPAVEAGVEVLRARVVRIAQAGQLMMSVGRAVSMIHAAGMGTVLTLLRTPEGERDMALSATTRDSMIAAITGNQSSPADLGPRAFATALAACLDQTTVLTKGEELLMTELLTRIANGA